MFETPLDEPLGTLISILYVIILLSDCFALYSGVSDCQFHRHYSHQWHQHRVSGNIHWRCQWQLPNYHQSYNGSYSCIRSEFYSLPRNSTVRDTCFPPLQSRLAGSVIYTVFATDPDAGSNAEITYVLTAPVRTMLGSSLVHTVK